MIRRRIAALAAVPLAATLIAASPEEPGARDPVDDALKACLAEPENETTAGMLGCTDAAYRAYDRRLNEVYQATIKGLDPKSADLLRASQRLWVQFREAERKALAGPWTADRGSMVSLEVAAAHVDAVRERIREIEVYGQAER